MRRGLLSDDDSSTYNSMDPSSSSSSSSTFFARLSPVARYALIAVGLIATLLLGAAIGYALHGSEKEEPSNPSSPSPGGSQVLSPLVVYISINGFRASVSAIKISFVSHPN